jgi:hypothetical protein
MTEEPPQPNKRKTYKREVGIVLLTYLMVLGWWGDFRVLEVLAWPFVAFALGAFGIDSYNKQTLMTPPPRPSPSTRPSKYDDWNDK